MDKAPEVVRKEEPQEVKEAKRRLLIGKAIEVLGHRRIDPATSFDKAMPVENGVIVASVVCQNKECGCTFGPIKLDGSYFGCPVCRTAWFERKDDEENVTLTRMKNNGRRKGRKRHGRRAVRGGDGEPKVPAE